ncbi:class I SAM-dependent methyltransferase [Desulfovibrio inopinatus]|uniref:class I SAM-dependent methyltransferase n=1 Tax=Desulfovibrio inopinatus TaxID=102109 RepID=UPI00068843BE|nr:class I SAM-dependent methyltransferase [Desulfovibrio inopinatus]
MNFRHCSARPKTPPLSLTHDDYAAFAAIYDPATALWLDPMRRHVVQILTQAKAKSVLDVCCGTGRFVRMLVDAGMTVSGLDISPSMLSQAQRTCGARATLSLQDATCMAFSSHTFDAAVIAMALHEKTAPVRQRILTEMIRIITPGGMLVLVDYGPHAHVSIDGVFVGLVERLAGKTHYANFKEFMHTGALDGLSHIRTLTPLHREQFTRAIFEVRCYQC